MRRERIKIHMAFKVGLFGIGLTVMMVLTVGHQRTPPEIGFFNVQCLLFGTQICAYYQAMEKWESLPPDPLQAERVFYEIVSLAKSWKRARKGTSAFRDLPYLSVSTYRREDRRSIHSFVEAI
jgi:hypothetical protein